MPSQHISQYLDRSYVYGYYIDQIRCLIEKRGVPIQKKSDSVTVKLVSTMATRSYTPNQKQRNIRL